MNEKQNESVYRTGHTSPPKSHSGLIAVLLVLVIFLGGIVSALGLLNIQLFRKLQSQEERCLSFETEAALSRDLTQTLSLESEYSLPGLQYRPLTPFYSRYYGISQGIYVSAVEDDSFFARQGIRPGDILTELDGLPCEDPDILNCLLEGHPVTLTLLRSGQPLELTLTGTP